MSNVLFPVLPGLTFQSTKTPQWSNFRQRSAGGMEVRGAYYTLPIWKWVLRFNFLRTYGAFTEWQTLAGFFNARQGGYDTFLYDDPTDDTVPDTPSGSRQQFGTGDGVTTSFQLKRTLDGTLFEPLYNLNSTPKLYVNGALQVGGYTITAGLVTFTAAPAAAAILTWSGTYYWRCRFSADLFDFEYFAKGFWDAHAVTFESVKGS